MRRDVAENIIRLARASDELFGELPVLTDEIEDQTERRRIRRALAEWFHVHEKITLNVVEQFPDLHPDNER